MAAPKTNSDGTPRKKRTRSAKARKICLLSETQFAGEFMFARNSDEAMDLVDKAQQEGRTLYFKRLTMPAPAAKVTEPTAA